MGDPERNLMTDPKVGDRISEMMEFIYRRNYGNSVKFLVGNESHDFCALFTASEFIVSASSPEFEKRTDESNPDANRFIVAQNYHPRAFKKVIRFMYTDKIDFYDPLDFIQIFSIANEYSILNLIHVCESYMQEPEIHEENAVCWLKAGTIVRSSFLKSLGITFIESRPEEVLNQKDFEKIEIEHLHRILRTLRLQLLSEVTLLKALCKWVVFNIDKDGFTHKTLTELMFENLRFIHFQSLTAQEFDNVLADYPDNFRQSDVFDIFCIIAKPDWGDYPEWMRRSKPRIIQKQSMEVDNSGPSYHVQGKKFLIPVEETKYTINLNFLETILKVVAKKPLLLAGLTLFCPSTTEQEMVALRWESHTFGFYEKKSNEMSYNEKIRVENNQIRIIFPQKIGMDISLVFVIDIKINFESIKSIELPARTAVPPKGAVFVPYGRRPYFEGDIIVKELHYI